MNLPGYIRETQSDATFRLIHARDQVIAEMKIAGQQSRVTTEMVGRFNRIQRDMEALGANVVLY